MICPACGESFAEIEAQLACEVHCPECGALLAAEREDGSAPAPAPAALPASAVPAPRAILPPPAAPVAPAALPAAPAAAADAAAEGKPFGRYRLLAPLGQGGIGVVWKAYDTTLRRLFALKEIRAADAGGVEAVQRFLAESRTAARLRHAHILSVHDVGEIEGRAYVTVDFVEGRSFLTYLESVRGPKPGRLPAEALRHEAAILSQVADAIAHAHSQSILHLALKPSNVLLDRKDRPYVMDFGLARALGPEAGPPPPLVARRLVDVPLPGTPGFLSPEQARGERSRVGPRSDVWALGVMLYEILAGRLPFPGESPWAVIAAVLDADPPAIGHEHRPVPDDLEALCGAALEKDPEKRPASAAEFAEDLRRWLRGEPVRVRKPSLLTRWSRRLRL